ncbi:MAG: hypothetical protein M3436_18935 [Pseudomonadota bacterium]|nr:hypothetical protein [Pseudomonadota bacterium]
MRKEKDAVWKTMDDSPTDETTRARKLVWASLDLFQLGIDRLHELRTQARILFLVPLKRFSEIIQRFRSENDWQAHAPPRIRRLTSSQGMPSEGLA